MRGDRQWLTSVAKQLSSALPQFTGETRTGEEVDPRNILHTTLVDLMCVMVLPVYAHFRVLNHVTFAWFTRLERRMPEGRIQAEPKMPRVGS